MSLPTFVRDLTSREQKELVRLIRSNGDARVVRRAQMVRLSAQGQTVSQIGDLWGTSAQTVRNTLKRFNREGLAALADKPRRGRPRKATERYVMLLKQVVQTSPRDLGYPFSSWTLERLREYVGRQTGVLLSPRYLSQLMGKYGIVYRRPKHVMGHLRDGEEYDEKQAVLDFLKKAQRHGRPASTCCTSMNVKFISTRP